MKIILNATERKPLAALLGEYKNTKPQYRQLLPLRLSGWGPYPNTRRKH